VNLEIKKFQLKIKKIFLIMILLLSINSFYSTEDINSYEYLQVEISNALTFGIDTQSDTFIESLVLKSYFFPGNHEDSQALNEFTSSITYSLKEDGINPHLEFDIKDMTNENNKIENTFIVQSTIDKPKITRKISFPQLELEEEYTQYTEFSGLIDSNTAIRAQASLLAQGEDDTYILASKIAKWIQEDITYDLSTITANPNQKSSDVFKSKVGVCKEITHLYISMMRSLGIPARVVTGYAYTNSEEVIELVGSNWGGHAWAEVLIGDTWVPFDLTYNQYGYVDASHIVLDKSKEIRIQSASIEGKGRKFEIIEGSLTNTNSFKVIDKKERIVDPGFTISIEGPTELSPQSYGHIKVTIENTQEYYQNIFLNLAKVPEVELLDLSEQMVILKPKESKEILFRYKIPDLDEGYIYTFPFSIYNQFFNEEYTISVQSGNQKLEEFSLPEVVISSKIFSENDLRVTCSGVVSFPDNTLFCTIKNPNNYELYNVNVCSESSCQTIGLKVNEQKSIELSTQSFESSVSLSYEDKKEELIISIPKPTFLFKNISLEKQLLDVSYSIENNYESLTSNIIINSSSSTAFDSKEVKEYFTLLPGEYDITLQILNGDIIIEEYSEIIVVEELTFFEKIAKFFGNIFDVLF
jgi:hypothetical protein